MDSDYPWHNGNYSSHTPKKGNSVLTRPSSTSPEHQGASGGKEQEIPITHRAEVNQFYSKILRTAYNKYLIGSCYDNIFV